MRPRPVVFFASAVLLAVCLGQWSEPVSISDTAFVYAEGFQLAAGGGDTLFASYIGASGVPNTSGILCYWSTGDSWLGPQPLNFDKLQFCLSAGVDARRRVWLAWYDGDYPTLHDTWGIYTQVHDSLGWGAVRLALPMGGIFGLSFAADKHGTWYMGIHEEGWHYSFALYSRLQGDTWTVPEYIAGGPDSIGYSVPALVARPDTGLWAVYSRHIYATLDRVVVDHLVPPDSQIHCADLYDLTGWTATGDSAGQLWVIYVDTLGAVRSITYDVAGEKGRQMVTSNRRRGPVVCTDAMGWVWAFWQQSDTTLAVSCNWGNGWSAPEAVTDRIGGPVDIVSDQYGRIYVCFSDIQGRYWTCYRTLRPGVGGDVEVKRLSVRRGASVVRTIPRDVVTFDAMGRRVENPRSGIYFVRDEGRGAGDVGRTRKVVIQR